MTCLHKIRGAARHPAMVLGIALVLGLALETGLLRAETAAVASTIGIDNFSFVPSDQTVPVGSTVTWKNDDDIPHLVVFSDGSFRSKALDTGDSTRFTFGKPGEVSYFCGLHPQMKGKITVVP